jgi:hypothetical protein
VLVHRRLNMRRLRERGDHPHRNPDAQPKRIELWRVTWSK